MSLKIIGKLPKVLEVEPAELLRGNEGAVGNRPACHRHIRRIFARMSTCSRVGLSPLAPSFGGGHERLSKWLSSESGMKRVRCA